MAQPLSILIFGAISSAHLTQDVHAGPFVAAKEILQAVENVIHDADVAW